MSEKPPLDPVYDRRRGISQRRRTARALLRVPMVIKWIAKDGSPQEETAETKIVNAHGALFLLKANLCEDMDVELLNLETNQQRKGKVVWCGSVERDGRNNIGIEFQTVDPKFWGDRYVDYLLWTVI